MNKKSFLIFTKMRNLYIVPNTYIWHLYFRFTLENGHIPAKFALDHFPIPLLWNYICECILGKSPILANYAKNPLPNCLIWRNTCSVFITLISHIIVKGVRNILRSKQNIKSMLRKVIQMIFLKICKV